MSTIGRIHVHQDNAGQRAAELKHRPFGAVSRPHTHAVAGLQSKAPQARRDTLRLVRVLRPSEPDVLVAADESDAFGKSMRENTMPVFAAAGRSVNSTLCPECRPMPTVLTIDLIVRCFSMVVCRLMLSIEIDLS